MATLRRNNTPNGLRIDVPYLKSIESAVSNDFDNLSNAYLTGAGKSYILRGFEFNMVGTVGSSATSIQMLVDGAAFMHGASTTSGTFYLVPVGTSPEILNPTVNSKVDGSFVANTLNYIGLDLNRAIDDTTVGQAYIWEPSTNTEITKTIPLAEVLTYKIVITSSPWAVGVLPIAAVQTDASNNVTRVEDRRPMFFRLGTGGTNTPDPFYTYPWSNQSEGRTENYWSSSSSVSPFEGGDKMILNEKEWKDAIMSALKEVKGTTYWYSANTGGSIIRVRSDIANLMMTGKGDITHDLTTPGLMNWNEDIFLNFIGSRLSYKLTANPSSSDLTLADNQVAYIKLVRSKPITPSLIFTQGSAIVSSVGSVSWTTNVVAGDFIKLAAADDTKYYKIFSVDSASQVTLIENYTETSTGASGAQAQYAWGSYATNPAPSTDRHIKIADRKNVPFDEDTYWLFLREDNGDSIARVYIRGNGFGELEQGESRQISDNTSLNIINYIGSPREGISTPIYSTAVTAVLVAEQFTVTLPVANSITSGQYWIAYSANDATKHGFYYDKDGAGGNPLIAGAIMHAIPISTGQTANQVATATHTIVNAIGDFSSVDNANGTITVTLSSTGSATDAANGNVGGTFAIVINTQGAGVANHFIIDTENLTKSIKRLDEALGDIAGSLDTDAYEEPLTVVSGAPANDNQVTGPITSGTNLTIPLNSRNSDIQQSYVVGSGDLTVFLNGVRQILSSDYSEVGATDSDSTQIQILVDLVVGDVIEFRKEAATSSGGGGGGSTYTGVNLAVSSANIFKQVSGTQFQFRPLTAGTNITIVQNANDVVINSSAGVASSAVNTYTTNQSITTANDIILGDATGGSITFTLPNASTCIGKLFYFKKLSSANTMSIKSVSSQTLDGVDIDAVPLAITVQYESVTITSNGSQFFIL